MSETALLEMNQHKWLVDRAKEAIAAVNQNTSVPVETTVASLKELQEQVAEYLMGLGH